MSLSLHQVREIYFSLLSLGLGFTETGSNIAKKFGLVHIDPSIIIKREIEEKTRIGSIISGCLDNGEIRISSFILSLILVPDDLICGLVYNEVTKSEARFLGWLLTGFPWNSLQLSKFSTWKIAPNVVTKL